MLFNFSPNFDRYEFRNVSYTATTVAYQDRRHFTVVIVRFGSSSVTVLELPDYFSTINVRFILALAPALPTSRQRLDDARFTLLVCRNEDKPIVLWFRGFGSYSDWITLNSLSMPSPFQVKRGIVGVCRTTSY